MPFRVHVHITLYNCLCQNTLSLLSYNSKSINYTLLRTEHFSHFPYAILLEIKRRLLDPRYREVRSQLREIRALDEQYGGRLVRRKTRPSAGIPQPDNMGVSVINGLRNHVNPYHVCSAVVSTRWCAIRGNTYQLCVAI